MTEESRFKPGTVCYFKVLPTSKDYWVNGMFVTITEKVVAKNGEPAWKFKPDIYSPRHEANFDYAFERTLVPIPGPSVDDVKDMLEVLALGNSATYEALHEIAKKVDRENTLEEIE